MKKKMTCIAALAVSLTGLCGTDAAARVFPFPMEGVSTWSLWENSRRPPAGCDGFIRAQGNDFVDGKGNVRRFLGINLYGPAQLCDRKTAEETARFLRYWGVSAIRLLPQYTWQLRADKDFSKGIDPKLLDRFDYFFAQLKKNGIYATMNLHSARTAGYRFADFRQTMKENKGLDNFDPVFIQHQKEYCHAIFNHVNPYTKLAYRDDPAVLSWEVNNECSLVGSWYHDNLWGKMTPAFRAEFTRQFNDWLKARYGDTASIRAAWKSQTPPRADDIPAAAWSSAAAFAKVPWYTEGYDPTTTAAARKAAYHYDPADGGKVVIDGRIVRKFACIDVPLKAGDVYTVSLRIRSRQPGQAVLKVGQHGRPYASQGFIRTVKTGKDWQDVSLTSVAGVTEACNRVQVEFRTRADYEIAAFSFRVGGDGGLRGDESLERRNILPQGNGSMARERDVGAFVLEAETRYWHEMMRYLREDLKAKQMVNGGTLDYGATYPQVAGDFLDNHLYYGGLAIFPGGKWNRKDWSIYNRALCVEPERGTFPRVFANRVFGRPYTISECSQMHQTTTAADFFPIFMAVSAFQNLSAVYSYAWTHQEDHSYGPTMWLDMHGNAKYLAHWPAARNMFERGDVTSGFTQPARVVSDQTCAAERARIIETGFARGAQDVPMDPFAFLKAPTGTRFTDVKLLSTGVEGVAAQPAAAVQTGPRRATSSTGEIAWDATAAGRERFVVDTPRTKFISAFGPKGTSQTFKDGTTVTLGDTLMNWAAISLTETKPRQWLLAATGWQQPTGAVVQVYGGKVLQPHEEPQALGKRITTCTAMGNVPFMCEGVRATVRIPVPAEVCVYVTPLDGNARTCGQARFFEPKDGFIEFPISEEFRTIWYRVDLRRCNLPAFGQPIPASAYDPKKPDVGLSAAKVFDAPIAGLTKVGQLRIPSAKEIPETSSASIGFEGLDRKLFNTTDDLYVKLGASGVKRARVQTMWSRCETEKGRFDFSVLDEIVDKLLAQGIRPWFCVSYGNSLYMKDCYTKAAVGYVPIYYGAECRAAWIRYVGELAKRYRGKVLEWEVWNESNIDHFWQPHPANARDYLELVKITKAAIRAAIPDAKIGGCTSSMGLMKWERDFFEAGGAKEIDFWCSHAYGQVPENFRGQQRVASKGTEPAYVKGIADMRAFIDAHGGRHVAIWQGESGFPSWFPKNHWLFPRGVCKAGWQSQANQAKWLLRRWLTDRRAGQQVSSFYHTSDIVSHYSMSHTTQAHPAEHGIVDGWTHEPKMSYYALGHYNALFATAWPDASVDVALTPSADQGVKTTACLFRDAAGRPLFLYYTPFNFAQNYQGKCYAPRTDATLSVPEALAPRQPVLVDMLRGGVYALANSRRENGRVIFTGLPLTDYPLVLTDRADIRLK